MWLPAFSFMPKGIYPHKKTQGMFGKKHSKKSRNKMKLSQLGHKGYWLGEKRPQETILKIKEKLTGTGLEEKNNNWKGDKVKYSGLHMWILNRLGNPKQCSNCGSIGKKSGRNWSIQWANIDHQYKRNLDDFIPLCVFCHRDYDFKNNNKIQINAFSY